MKKILVTGAGGIGGVILGTILLITGTILYSIANVVKQK